MMNVGKRVGSAPVLGSQETKEETAFSFASTNGVSEKQRTKLPRSPGFLNNDSSLARLEFQDNKKSMDELREFARTTPPSSLSPLPNSGLPSAASLSRTDSGRRRRILEHIAHSGNLPSKSFKRLLFRLNRSATTSDLTRDTVAQGSIDIARKRSSSGRKYKKIAFNPKIYETTGLNLSTYNVNKEFEAKGLTQKLIRRRSKPQAELDNDTGDICGQTSHMLDETDDYCRRVKDEYPHLILGNELAKGANNGYSPSKRIPEPEFGPDLRDFARMTLANAQAHARIAKQVSTSPERKILQSQHHGSPVRNHGNHASRRSASSKGPYSVPIKFQMRPQRVSLPKTPRTSLDEPSTLKETSPIVNGKAKASSTLSGSDSVATDESGEIMNAQSAELIRGQGTFAYHTRTSQKPPRSGPAPTRALPSLPEGHDSVTPKLGTAEKHAPSASVSQLTSGSSPKQKVTKSPPKGHRYRLSPVKNNIRKDVIAPTELKPSPKFTEEFPKPPNGSPMAASPRLDRGVDASKVVACLQNESPDPPVDLTTKKSRNVQEAASDTKTSPNTNGVVLSRRSETPNQQYTDYDKDYLYLPWQGSRVERVKALRVRDLERLRPHEQNVTGQSSYREDNSAVSGDPSVAEEGAVSSEDSKISSKSQLSSVLVAQDSQSSNQTDPGHGEDIPSYIGVKNGVSPIITIAEQPPVPVEQIDPHLSHLGSVDDTAASSTGSHEQTSSSLPSQSNTILRPDLHIPSPNPQPPRNIHRTAPLYSSTSTKTAHLDPSSVPPHPRPNSYPSPSTSDLEARIASLEKKNLLLERAFLAVIDTSCGFAALENFRSTGDVRDCSVWGEGGGR
ncbi:MAG: hypothetical protein L6R41_000471 [Letrouitia leprolyta]|nr:MAG: hypothetical protein L6R41_000471 [Letrouitia leprolyta]